MLLRVPTSQLLLLASQRKFKVSFFLCDAFCDRTPKSVLARHYTDNNPERLKEIYEKTFYDLSLGYLILSLEKAIG